MTRSIKLWSNALLLSAIIGSSRVMAYALDPACGDLTENYLHKPTDYRTAPQEQLNLVERPHFRTEHATILKGQTEASSGYGQSYGGLMAGFDYTLRVFPNHHLALQDIDRLGLMLKTEKPAKAHFSLECYYKRAIAFVPDDSVVRLLYGLYLNRRGRIKEGVEQLQAAEENAPDDSNVQYNLGLAWFQIKDYDKAREYAKRAYEGGFPLPGLRQMLIKAGQWKE
ncbi:MAG: hypothetical protein LBV49_10675 [Azonexus sp.]|jgi:tetratricopeptide (TPR) repeat protein|nr:hypothetical protein [Azonexus sp.]